MQKPSLTEPYLPLHPGPLTLDESAVHERMEQEFADSLDRALAGNDTLAVAIAEIKRQAAEIAALKSSRDSILETCNEAIRRFNATHRELQRVKALVALRRVE